MTDGTLKIPFDPYLEIVGKAGGGAAVACRLHFDDFGKAMEFNSMIVDFIQRHGDFPRCAKCEIPLTDATADGREDGLYCDKCLTESVDGVEKEKL